MVQPVLPPRQSARGWGARYTPRPSRFGRGPALSIVDAGTRARRTGHETKPMEDAMLLTARAPLNASALERRRRFSTAFDLRGRASRRMPRLAFEYMDGGAAAC